MIPNILTLGVRGNVFNDRTPFIETFLNLIYIRKHLKEFRNNIVLNDFWLFGLILDLSRTSPLSED